MASEQRKASSSSESTSTSTEEDKKSKSLSSNKEWNKMIKESIKSDEEHMKTNKSSANQRETVIKFVRSHGHQNMARAHLELRNVRNRPFQYKIKCEQNVDITAQSNSSGYVKAFGSARCLLTWHQAQGFDQQQFQTKLIFYIYFVDMNDKNVMKRITMRFTAMASPNEYCDATWMPAQQLTVDIERREDDTKSIIEDEGFEISMQSSRMNSKMNVGGTVDEILDWLCSQSEDTLVLLILCGLIIYSMGFADSH
ncbi:unnamed protein product [Anisakis simplex]|uniref:Major sperm protein n=1 Tax=Anisakis simplex TaxID=6269 RepID=A0A0M3JS35_ANISI|nr:unnamed protein product [Anisakis simplex]